MEVTQNKTALVYKLLCAAFLGWILLACGQKMEDFNIFLDRFMSDKEFELERTVAPLLSIRHEFIMDESGKDKADVSVTRISREALEEGPTLSAFLAENELFKEIKPQGSDPSVQVVKVFKADSDWQFEYHFVNKEGNWYLQSIHDYSL